MVVWLYHHWSGNSWTTDHSGQVNSGITFFNTIPFKLDNTCKCVNKISIKEIQTGTNTSLRDVYWLSFDCYADKACPARKVVKLKTYMLILNCCINVLSHRNRFEYRTVLLNISGAELNKRSIGSATKILNANQIWTIYDIFAFFRLFSDVTSRNLLVPYFDWAKAINKET